MSVEFLIPLILLNFGQLDIKAQDKDFQNNSILAVFAHPDDEIYVAPILSKFARKGAKVNLIIVTDGRYGPGESGLPSGQELVELRKRELECSADNLGIEKLITLGYHDQLKMTVGLSPHVNYARRLIVELDSLITKLDPDIMITWGPEGGTNHPDHRLVGASITQIFLSKMDGDSKLFFVGIPSERMAKDTRLLYGVEKSYLNTRISFDEIDFQNTVSALQCYKSQFSTNRITKRVEEMKKYENVVYLREFAVNPVIKTHLE